MSAAASERIAGANPVIRSMTGQGRARAHGELGAVSVEIRTVNNRGLKCVVRTSDNLAVLSARIEGLIRGRLHRGSINVQVNWRAAASSRSGRIDTEILQEYVHQISAAQAGIPSSIATAPIDVVALVGLPGVLAEREATDIEIEPLWGWVAPVVDSAIDRLDEMRAVEAKAMVDTLRADLQTIENLVEQVRELTPSVVMRYRDRLEGRIRDLLDSHELNVDQIDLLKEVQVFSDRIDVSEEVTRLASHLALFDSIVSVDSSVPGDAACAETDYGGQSDSSAVDNDARRDPVGRRLDFLLQEMFRETNTIGSKAADAGVSARVVEIKCALERMRELVQNLE